MNLKNPQTMMKHETEVELISASLLNPEYMPILLEYLKPEHFNPINRKAFNILETLYNEGTLTAPMIKERFSQNKVVVKPYLEVNKPEDVNTITEKCRRLVDLSINESLMTLIASNNCIAQSSTTGLDNAMNFRKDLDNLILGMDAYRGDLNINKQVDSFFEQLTLEHEGKSSGVYFSRCFPGLTEKVSFKSSSLILLNGFSSNGKTTAGLNLIADFVMQGIPCGIFSIEMTSADILSRLVAITTGIEAGMLRNGAFMGKEAIAKAYSSTRELLGDKILLIDDRTNTITGIETKLRQWKHKWGIKIVLLDYLQLLNYGKASKIEQKYSELEEISRRLKQIAKELDIVLISCSQLNRAGKTTPNAINTAGSISAVRDSDIALTIHKPVLCEDDLQNNMKGDSQDIYFEVNGRNIKATEHHFILKVDKSRYSASGGQILIEMKNGARMQEVA